MSEAELGTHPRPPVRKGHPNAPADVPHEAPGDGSPSKDTVLLSNDDVTVPSAFTTRRVPECGERKLVSKKR
jgi:hypothetical protein